MTLSLDNYAYVFFVCEGTNEEEILKWICENNKLCLDKSKYTLDYCRARAGQGKEELKKQCLQIDYGGPIVVVYLCDSRKEQWSLGKNAMGENIPVIRIWTRPEIEILLILSNEKLYDKWERAKRKKHNIKPSEFCKSEVDHDIKKKGHFVDAFRNFQIFEECCHKYKSRYNEEPCIYDLIAK